MTTAVIPVYKPIGWTPLEVVHRYRAANPSVHHEKISYAGRLDPMAEGVLLLVVGDQSVKADLLTLTKTYDVTMILGITSDTYDILGLIDWTHLERLTLPVQIDVVASRAQTLVGTYEQPYPPFSSKTVHGKPLFTYAKNGTLSQIQIPTKMTTVRSFEITGMAQLDTQWIGRQVAERIALVRGDFRQHEITASWQEFVQKTTASHLTQIGFTADVSSGTYMRSLVSRLGEMLGTGALTWSIVRTRVGNYARKDCERV